MFEEKTFELNPVLDSETGNYIVNNFDVAKKIVADFIEREVNSVVEITDDIVFSSAKKIRTDIRKRKDMITQARIQINALLLGKFNEQLKEIETMLDTADKDLKAKVDKYNLETKGKDNKPKVITLVCKGYNIKEIEKVKEFALKHGLTAEVK